MAAPEQPLVMARGCTSSSSVSPPRGDRTLLVRHLPAELTAEEKEDLLKYFGAQSVRVLSDKGRLKHTAFATFPNEKAAIKALTRLHQLKLLGHTLVVEFAKEQDHVHSPCPTSVSEKKKRSDEPVEDDKEKKELGYLTVENGIAPNHGLTFPLNSCLKYMYPPPSSTILANIVNALASVPKFYVQVLHLMNKMNLPTPFGPITARPPMYEDYMPLHAPLPPTSPQPPEEPPLPDEDEELSSAESEYESSDDEDRQRFGEKNEQTNGTSKSSAQKTQNNKATPCEEKEKNKGYVEYTFVSFTQKDLEKEQNHEEKDHDIPATEVDASNIGFGKIFPKPNLNITEEIKEDSDEMPSECISRRELEKGRISREGNVME
ncbi:RNA-binding region-containing protein 3 [Saguinus oedipus]|uniref:RNA-binding region-containing protein 3 n=1 Tax=Saguinus oedipus TaxID=9490 RepID=A0ABQ9VCN9_SAGOE|nr:RNA-binding region-containing protein 3 [Saguinus oedipus]